MSNLPAAILESALSAPVTYSQIIIVFICSCLFIYKKAFFAGLVLHPNSVIRKKEYCRIITSDLVYNDIAHLMLNEFILYVFCTDLEETLRKGSVAGSWEFLCIYLASLLAGAIIIIIRHHREFGYSSAGAPGSIMGCMFGLFPLSQNTSLSIYR